MIKYKTASDNIYNFIAFICAIASLLILVAYQVFLLINKDLLGFDILYNAFVALEIAFICAGAFFSFKQLIRNRHIETITAAVILSATLFSFIIFIQ
ncbi:MAG TPA: hypothetical protein VIL23_03810 [Clostridia bacterium]